MLTEYCKRLDNAVLRHESRYDVLGDFTSAHLSILENFSFRPGATHSAAKVQGGNHMHKVRKFVKDRPMYKKNHLDCSMYLLCGGTLGTVPSRLQMCQTMQQSVTTIARAPTKTTKKLMFSKSSNTYKAASGGSGGKGGLVPL